MSLIKRVCLYPFSNNRFLLEKFVGVYSATARKYNTETRKETVRIGCASGFWGDSPTAAPQLIYHGKIDFLVFDYLSEITMSLLTASKQKYPNMGYAPDFVHFAMVPYLQAIKDKGIRVVSNAGGINPQACAEVLRNTSKGAGIDLNIAVVTGDNLMPVMKDIAKLNIKDMSSGMEFPKTIHSMNTYLGAGPIARALDLGADIVVTGRCVDSALVLGPLLHTFKYEKDNFNHLAAASLAGHIVECGAQATGGIFTDWHTVEDWDNIGFPIVECSADGSFIVTKPQHTGGLVSRATVSEQMLYEIGDPKKYLLPDVTCDFSNVQIKETGTKDAVLVEGVKGKPPTNNYKVTATYADGYRATTVSLLGGPRSEEKAKKTADAILKRCRNIFNQLKIEDFTKVNIELLGAEPKSGNQIGSEIPRQFALWIAVHHASKKALEVFAKEVAPAGTGMAPGFTAIVGGRPRISPVLKLFSFLYPKNKINVEIYMNGELKERYNHSEFPSAPEGELPESLPSDSETSLPTGTCEFLLEDLAYTRSGDKGNSANIGVIARQPSFLPYLRRALTEATVEQYFSYLFEDDKKDKRVTRYDVPGIHGMNFVLHNCLGGGGIASLRTDPQGKALGQQLLNFKVSGVPDLLSLQNP